MDSAEDKEEIKEIIEEHDWYMQDVQQKMCEKVNGQDSCILLTS